MSGWKGGTTCKNLNHEMVQLGFTSRNLNLVHVTQEIDGISPNYLMFFEGCGNDPSAGSPTETLLRLHLPLNDEV